MKQIFRKVGLLVFMSSTLLSLTAANEGYTLVWSDEFDGGYSNPDATTGLNMDVWNFETGNGNGGWGTGQRDYSTKQKANVEVSSGTLKIRTHRNYPGQSNEYTSGRLNTKGKKDFLYGRIEARIRTFDYTESGRGFAFWMMPNALPAGSSSLMWPQGGEIDIFEYNGLYPQFNLGSMHYAWDWKNNTWGGDGNHANAGGIYNYWDRTTSYRTNGRYPACSGAGQTTSKTHLLGSDWHIYGIEWYSDKVEFFVEEGDGSNHDVYFTFYLKKDIWCDSKHPKNALGYTTTEAGWTFDKNGFPECWRTFENPFYVILSSGVGGQNTYGGDINSGNNPNQWTCYTEIDWVRHYVKNDFSAPVIELEGGEVTAGKITIAPTLISGKDIQKIEVTVDKWQNKAVLKNGSSLVWDATSAKEGNHKIYVRVCDSDGYWSNRVVVTYKIVKSDDPVAVDAHTLTQVSIYPNPTSDILNISLKNAEEIETADMYDMTGKKVKSLELVNGTNQVSVTDLPKGMYIIRMQTSDAVMTEKVMLK